MLHNQDPRWFMDKSDIQLIDVSKHPEVYKIGRGEQGVFLYEPYRSTLLPHWKFKTVDDAKESSKKLYSLFLDYLAQNDFPGADMAKKYLQMGFTRARRYANHASGRKYDARGKVLPLNKDPEKAQAARIFLKKYQQALKNTDYLELKEKHKETYGV